MLEGASKDNWNCRFKDPTGKRTYIRKSLKTQNLATATKRAMELYNEANVRKFLDAPDDEVTWDYIFNKYLQDFPASTQKKAIALNRRYFSEFFGTLPDLYKLDSGTVISYFYFRSNYWKNNIRGGYNQHHPTDVTISSLSVDSTILRKILTRAFNDRFIHRMPQFPTLRELEKMPNVINIELKARRKRFKTFISEDGSLKNEYITTVLPKLRQIPRTCVIKKQGNGGRQDRYSGMSLWFYLLTIANTGIRPQEMKRLKFKDFSLYRDEKENEYTIVLIRREIAKTGVSREVVSRDMSDTFNRLQKYRAETELYWGTPVDDDDYIFPHLRDKSKPRSMMSTVRYFHQKLGIHSEEIDGVMTYLTAYSYRSLCISMMLKDGVDIFSVARNTGTAVSNISKYYDVSSTLSHRELLTKQIQQLSIKP